MEAAVPYIAVGCSILTLLLVSAEKIFGGGNALAGKFHALEKEMTAAVATLRTDMNSKVNEYEKISVVGFEAIKSNIHAMQLGLLEFRAKMAEELHMYIRKDDYNAGINDVKRDVENGFHNMNERVGQLQDLIMYAIGERELPPRVPKNHGKTGL